MQGHGEKLIRKQEAVIGALLTEKTIAEAAKKAGVNESTIHRWLKTVPEFEREYRQARQRNVEHAIAQLQTLTGKAVETLERNLNAEKPADQIKAATAIIDRMFKGMELLELESRVAQIEERLEYWGGPHR